MSKPLFFFGAGAENTYGVVTGEGFRQPLLKPDKDQKRALKGLLGDDYKNAPLLHHKSQKIYLQTIYSNPDEAKKVFDEERVAQYISYYRGSSKDDKNKFDFDMQKIAKQWYKLLTDDTADSNLGEKEIKDFFLKNAVFFDSLDEKFNSLRYVDWDNSNMRRVVNAYFLLFIEMLKGLYNTDEFDWSMPNVLDLLNREYTKPKYIESYYTILRDRYIKTNNGERPCSIATTNYTNLSSIYTQQKNIIYLHGKMTWFEDYKHLVIYDCTIPEERQEIIKICKDDYKTILPFILIPSGVKPLICKKQIDEFSKFGNALWDKETKVAVVVGYRFNSEDNHINSMFSEWLRENGHTLIVLNYHSNIKWDKLLWTEDINIKEVKPSSSDLQKINSEGWNSGILDILVDENSAIPAFETVLDVLKGQEEQR